MKKKKIIVLVTGLIIIAALLVGIFLIPAKENGESINGFVNRAIDEAMEAEKALDEQTIDTELSVPPKVISESWSVARLYKKYHNKKRKEIDFDIPQQRGIAWDI